MNLPNKITIVRILMIPIFLIFMLVPGITYGQYIAAAIFILAALTDALDGYLARKNNLITNFGKFMDPLADKLLVSSALISFVELKLVPAWIVILIIAREFIISGFRLIASDNGVVIAASWWGKLKTNVQIVMSVMLIINLDYTIIDILEQIAIYLALALTIISMVDYIWKNIKVLSENNSK
ncbi:CDP-diacylglycerol--glycerol-3-phosphate 3-phosphatidyltransferase [Mobilitalea sibirica]|uniref:CDP-diacylglycerol--glycerol-3-phosphate 3-phosphatidyltransferase n=1 Tax=Mobilitalea sibirica TaxID=1462919 RepID=A0A8J7HC34_9FIRM|nr:CDP-diacylglycerol--glycerol-3-phosphate 3-phosphatidyltransferase [Mobilitalea sibirica]MBH1942376.1 CDP-diacylglycerol--glycerol-3-phosphate 3-phosphatidyltransferase [Mobilitalea sibirica]